MKPLVVVKHLLWKDYRQMRPAIVGCWAILAAILVLATLCQLTDVRDQFLPDIFMGVLCAPTLVAIAASGILIGHERQTRTWNWSSSLPVPWSSTLLSKGIVWLVASALMVGTLYALFLLLVQGCRMSGYNGETVPIWLTPQIVLGTVLIVPLIVLVWFTLAALLWDDTLSAFAVCAVVVGVGYLIVSDMLPRLVLGIGNANFDQRAELWSLFLTIALLVVVPGLFMVRSYRWRWTSGQQATLGWGRRVPSPVNSLQRRLMWQSLSWSDAPRSELSMLLAHGLVQSLATRLIIFGITLGLVIYGGMCRQFESAALFAGVGATLLGTTVFGTDQVGSAYRFFADRGVTWHKLLLAHVAMPLTLAVIPGVLTAAMSVKSMSITSWDAVMLIGTNTAVMFGLFAIGLFCGLCARIPLMAAAMAIGAAICATMVSAALQSFYAGLQFQFTPTSIIASVFLVQLVCVLAASVVLLKRWLVKDRVSGPTYFLVTLVLAILPVNVLAYALCFLAVPNVPWQGLEPSQVKMESDLPQVILASVPVGIPNRFYTTHPSQIALIAENAYRDGIGVEVEQQPDSYEDITFKPQGKLARALKTLEKQLDELDPAEPKTVKNIDFLCNQIESTAWLAAYATQKLRDLELARRAWKVNSQLLTLIDYSCLDGNAANYSRLTSVLLRKHLTPEDWEFLRTGGPLAPLQPQPLPRETWARMAMNIHTRIREELREDMKNSWVAWLASPIRWHAERIVALRLHNTIDELYGRPALYAHLPKPTLRPESYISFLFDVEASLPR